MEVLPFHAFFQTYCKYGGPENEPDWGFAVLRERWDVSWGWLPLSVLVFEADDFRSISKINSPLGVCVSARYFVFVHVHICIYIYQHLLLFVLSFNSKFLKGLWWWASWVQISVGWVGSDPFLGGATRMASVPRNYSGNMDGSFVRSYLMRIELITYYWCEIT